MSKISCRLKEAWKRFRETKEHIPRNCNDGSLPIQIVSAPDTEMVTHAILNEDDHFLNTAMVTHELRDFDLPYPRNKHFCGREMELSNLETQLRPDQQTKGLKQLAIVAPAGHGKTQLALEFAYRQKVSMCTMVQWIDCTTRDTARLSFSLAMKEMGYPDSLSDNALVQWKLYLRGDLSTRLDDSMRTKWLLIFDNVHHVPIVRDLWPLKGSWGSVIVITQDQGIGRAFAPKYDPTEYHFEYTDSRNLPYLENTQDFSVKLVKIEAQDRAANLRIKNILAGA